jgi:outer membrane protein TolC
VLLAAKTWRCVFLLTLCAAPAAAGQALSFDDAVRLAVARSDALAGARANVDSQTHKANSLDYLDYPRVDFDAKALESEKTVGLDLTGVRSTAGNALATLTPVLGPSTVSALASQIPSSAVLGVKNSGLRANVEASLPIYTGGKIDAAQKAAKAGIRVAGAEFTLTEQALRTQLAEIYFLHQLALRVRDVRRELRDGLAQHLANAKRAEKAGMIARAQTLQAQVAYDEAVRGLIQSEADVRSTAVALANLLHLPAAPAAATPLFVQSARLPPVEIFLDAARAKHGQLARLDALDEQAGEGVRAETADRLPQVYAFGEYDFSQRNWDLTTPDWAFGLGVRYSLFSGIDRSEAEEAAVQKKAQVEALIRQTRLDLTTVVSRAYEDLDAARERFLLLDSTLASARENVRVQDVSFRAGVATSVDVVDARLALSRALVERAEAAYRFDDALARLLAASGQAESYSEYIATADRVIAE